MQDKLKNTPQTNRIFKKISESLSLNETGFENLILSKVINECWDFKNSEVDIKKTRKFFNL